MAKINITDEDRDEFRKTRNGMKKALWMYIGMVIDFFATLSVCLLNIFAYKLPSAIWFYVILYLLLVIVVVGGEFIGTYFGALEQYVLDKKMKKELQIED